MDAGQVALAAVIASVIGPLLLAALTNRNRRLERQEDYARQDEVASRAMAVAASIEDRQRALDAESKRARAALERYQRERTTAEQVTAELLLASNDQVRVDMERAHAAAAAQLRQIHTLVNSELTAAQRRERDATVAMLEAMREVVLLRQKAGIDPPPETLGAMAEIQRRIDILSASLAVKQNSDDRANEGKAADDNAEGTS